MHTNNNQTVVRRISGRSAKANKIRNIFAVMAIVLTTFMISTIFSIGISFAENYAVMTMRTAGTAASIFLKNPTGEQYDRIRGLGYIKAAGTQISIGSVSQKTAAGKDAEIGVFCYDKDEWKHHYTPAISDINGVYPSEADEIMLSLAALEQLGISNPETGMDIPLTLVTPNGEISENFRLTGWFKNYKDLGSGGIGTALVSEKYCADNGYTLYENGMVSVSTGTGRQNSVYEKLQKDVTLDQAQEFETSFFTDEESDGVITGTIAVVGILALFIVLSGFLLIYNVIYISVSKDIRFFGLLKTVGTSPKQIKRIVRSQIYRLSLAGIPLGLLFGVAASFGIVPLAMDMIQGDGIVYSSMPGTISFHPAIFIGTAMFAFLTVFLSCRKPAKTAGAVSPVEALRYTGVKPKKKEKDRKSTKGGKLYRMAFYNVFREKKRAFLVFASLLMGTITLLSVNGFLGSLKVENYISRYYPHDFLYQNLTPDEDVFNNAFTEELRRIDGITNFEITKSFICSLNFDEDVLEPFLKGTYYDNPYFSAHSEFATYEDFTEYLKNYEDYGTRLFSIDDSYVEAYNKTHENKIDLEAFRRGEIVIIGNAFGYKNMPDMIGKDIILTENDTGKEKTVTVGGIFDRSDCNYGMYAHAMGEPDAIYVSEAFLGSFTDNAKITYINADVEPAKEPSVNARLKAMNAQLSSSDRYVFEAKTDVSASFKSSITTMNVLADGVSLILILIGILNFINVMLTGVHARRKELAVMESIGMTKKQIRKMLAFEGLYYAFITTALIMTIGNGILYLISDAVPKIADYAVLHYPAVLMMSVIAVIFVICLLTPDIVYRMTVKESVTERLHGADI